MKGGAAQSVTERQRACLRLVLEHKSSKDIARELGISRHTVDQRLRLAMRTLGAASRVEAARILAASEGGREYQRTVHQPSHVAFGSSPASASASAHEGQRQERRADGIPGSLHSGQEFSAGVATPQPPGKELQRDALFTRTARVVAIAAGIAVLFAALFVGLNALSEFTR